MSTNASGTRSVTSGGKRCAVLTDLQYQLFVSLLKTKQMPSAQLLKAADLLNESDEVGSPSPEWTRQPQTNRNSKGKTKAECKGKFRNAITRGFARFKAWASRMRLDDHDRLIFKRTGKIILPKRKFASKIREIHLNQGTDRHLSFPKTYAQIQEMYTVGKRQFGMSEDMVRQVIRKCSCSLNMKDNNKKADEETHDKMEEKSSGSTASISSLSGDKTSSLSDTCSKTTGTLPPNIQTIPASHIITPSDQLQKLPSSMCVVKVQPGGGIQFMYQPQNSSAMATFKLTVPQTTSNPIIIPVSGLQFINAINTHSSTVPNVSYSVKQPILQWYVKPSTSIASPVNNGSTTSTSSKVEPVKVKRDSPTLKSMLTNKFKPLSVSTTSALKPLDSSLLNTTAVFPSNTVTTASVSKSNKRKYDKSPETTCKENIPECKKIPVSDSSMSDSKGSSFLMENVSGVRSATESPENAFFSCDEYCQLQDEVENQAVHEELPLPTSLLNVREGVPGNIAWNFTKDEVEKETNVYSRALAVLKDAKLDVKRAIINKSSSERLRKKLLYAEDLFRLCKHRVFMEAVKYATNPKRKSSPVSLEIKTESDQDK